MRKIVNGMVALAVLSGCASKEQTGSLIGGAGGSGLGTVVGTAISHAGPVGALVGLAGGLAGSFAGGAVGRSLDARDRQRAAQSVEYVLAQPIDYPRAEVASAASFDDNVVTPATPAPARPRPPAAAATALPTPPVVPAMATPTVARPVRSGPIPLPNVMAPTSHWVSDHSGARGSSTVISAQPPTENSRECRTIRNTAYIDSREVTETKRMCLTANNSWRETASAPL